MNKRILVTGGFGFIGTHVLDALIEQNKTDEIINIDYLGIGCNIDNIAQYKDKVTTYVYDISHESITNIFKTHKPTHIIHLAAESHVDRSITNPLSFIQSNVVGTANILECARKYADPDVRILHVSTDEVYGHLDFGDMPFIETTPIHPRSPYSASKASSDVLALAYKNTYNMDITVTRCCNNYGPRQHDEKLIPTIIKSVVNGKKIPIYGDGQNMREWIFVKDHAAALLEVLFKETKHEIYNIYGNYRCSNLTLATHIVDILIDLDPSLINESGYVNFVADRPGHDLCYKMSSIYADIEALTRQTQFKAGLLDTVKYYFDTYK